MLGKALTQACCIGALAVAIGAVHAAMSPVQLQVAPQPVRQPEPRPEPQLEPRVPVQPSGPSAPAPTPQPQAVVEPVAGGMVTIEQVRAMQAAEPVQFVDARNAAEFAKGHLPAAVLLSPDMFASGLPDAAMTLDRGFPVVVYCTGGQCDSSKLVAIRLQQIGFSRLYIYEGGFDAWKAAGMPIDLPGGTPK